MTPTDSQSVHGNLLRDSQVRKRAGVEGGYEASMSPAWTLFSAFGGMMVALAMRAAHEAVGEGSFVPLYASALFPRALKPGPLHIDTEVLMRNSAVAQVAADLRPVDQNRSYLRLIAAYGATFPAPATLQELEYPQHALPVEDSIPNAPHPLSGMPLFQQFTTRWAHEFWNRPGHPPRVVAMHEERAETCSWIRFNESPLLADGRWDPIALAVAADYMAPAIFRGLGSAFPLFYPTTLSMDLHVFATTEHPWVLQHCRIVRFADGYACATIELWDPDRRLLALSTQRRFCKPLPPATHAKVLEE